MVTPPHLSSETTPPPRVSPLHDSKDIRSASPVPGFPGPISLWAWRFYTHRLTQAGRWYFTTAFVFLMFGFTSLDLQAFIPFTYALGIGVVAIVSVLGMRPSARIKAEFAERIGAGETLTATLHVTNHGKRFARDWSVAAYRLPPPIDPGEVNGILLPKLAPGDTTTVAAHFYCRARGRFLLRGWRVQTDYPFGLLRAYTFVKEDRPLLVYPRFSPLSDFDIPIGRRYQPGGVALASRLGDSFEYLGNREYRSGDNVRHIDWRATARLNRPIVREYREEYFHRVAVVLDTQTDTPAPPRGHEDDFERAVSLCASISDWLSRREYVVDLFAAGPNLYHLTAGRSLAFIDQILDILACLETTRQEPFSTLEPEIVAHLAQITAVICVFLDWNDARRALARRLEAEGAAVKILIVRDTACTEDPLREEGHFGALRLVTRAEFQAGFTEL
jgi:uncharacterized protein (DUF58 family)